VGVVPDLTTCELRNVLLTLSLHSNDERTPFDNTESASMIALRLIDFPVLKTTTSLFILIITKTRFRHFY